MEIDHNAHPLNPLPWVCWVLALPIAAVEIVLSLAGLGVIGGPDGIGWRVEAVQRFGFSGPLFQWMAGHNVWPVDGLWRFVSYIFVHYNAVHAIFVVVFILALGKFVSEVFRPWAVLAIFFVSAIFGAVAYGTFTSTNAALLGGYPAVYGLIGAFSFILWTRLGERGANRMGAFSLIFILLGFQLLAGLTFGGSNEWIADLAGFVAGFLLSFVVAPGGIRRALDRIRRR